MSEMNEKCPKCGSIFIQWNGNRFECLVRICRHKWLNWPRGPKSYEELENPHLRASLPRGCFPKSSIVSNEE